MGSTARKILKRRRRDRLVSLNTQSTRISFVLPPNAPPTQIFINRARRFSPPRPLHLGHFPLSPLAKQTSGSLLLHWLVHCRTNYFIYFFSVSSRRGLSALPSG